MEGFLLSVSTIAPAKIAAYRATHYRVCAPGKAFTLLIGIPSGELSQLYLATGASCALFIAAFNPLGRCRVTVKTDRPPQSGPVAMLV